MIATTSRSRIIFPRGPPKPSVVPFPDQIHRVLDREWENPFQSRHPTRVLHKLYTLQEEVMKKRKVPLFDSPIVALSSPSTLSSEG